MKKIYYLLLSLIFINQQEIFSQGPWTFSNSNDVWESTGTAANLTTSATYSILDINGAGNPQLRSYQASIDANIKNTAVIKIKNNTSNTVMRVFYNDGASLSDFSDTGSGWKYTNVTISANDTDVKTYYVKVDSNAAWTGTINNITIQFREDSNYNSALDDGLGNIYIYDVTMIEYKWTFDGTNANWTGNNANGFASNSTNATLTLKTINGSYSGIRTTVGIVGQNYPYLVVRIQNSSDRNKLRVKFDKDDNINFGYKSIDISTNDTDFKTYYVNMGSLPAWNTSGSKDDITIQIGPNTTNAGTTIFDDVRFLTSSKDISQLTFDGDADYQTLSAANDSSVTNHDGYVTWTLDGTNNNAKLEMKTSGFYYTTDADMNKLVTVELINVSANNQLAFVSTSGNQQFTPISMDPNDTDDPTGTAQSIIFNITKDNWSGATNNSWFLRARNSSNSNAVESGHIYIKSITFSDNTTPIETIGDGDWSNSGTWYGGVVPSYKQTVNINHNITSSSFLNMRSMTIDSGKSFITTSTFSGDVTYNRNLATNNWYLVSSPVVGETVEDLIANHTFSGTTNLGLSTYNTVDDTWTYVTASSTGSVPSGTGYAVQLASAGDISFTGTIKADDTSISLATSGRGFNLIGNPYTSFLNSGDILTRNTSIIASETIWVWDQNDSEYDTFVSGVGSLKVAPGQGFFVKSNGVAGSISILESDQSHESDTFQKSENLTQIYLKLSDGNTNRKTKLYFLDNVTYGFDNGYDGPIFGGSSNSFSIYTQVIENGTEKKLAIQSLPKSEIGDMIIPIGINAIRGKTITITAENVQLQDGEYVYLEDRENNIFTHLNNENKKYEISLSEDLKGFGRFFLHTSSKALNVNNITLSDISVYKSNNNTLNIVGLPNGDTAELKLYNILGKKVLNTNFNTKGLIELNLPNLSTGVYLIEINSNAVKFNKKIIME